MVFQLIWRKKASFAPPCNATILLNNHLLEAEQAGFQLCGSICAHKSMQACEGLNLKLQLFLGLIRLNYNDVLYRDIYMNIKAGLRGKQVLCYFPESNKMTGAGTGSRDFSSEAWWIYPRCLLFWKDLCGHLPVVRLSTSQMLRFLVVFAPLLFYDIKVFCNYEWILKKRWKIFLVQIRLITWVFHSQYKLFYFPAIFLKHFLIKKDLFCHCSSFPCTTPHS